MTFSNYSCHVTPLYKNLSVLKLNDIYRLELAKFMHKLHHGALPKIFDNFFKNISTIHSYKTRFADNQNYFMQRVCTNSGKRSISSRGAALWKEIEQSLKIVPFVTFCKHYSWVYTFSATPRSLRIWATHPPREAGCDPAHPAQLCWSSSSSFPHICTTTSWNWTVAKLI